MDGRVCLKCNGTEWVAPTTNTSDWETEFDGKLPPDGEGYNHVKHETLKSTIRGLIERAREEALQARVTTIALKVDRKNYEAGHAAGVEQGRSEEATLCHKHAGKDFEAGHTAATAEVKRLIEEMQQTDTPNVPQGYPKMIGYNRALSDLLIKLTDTK